MMLDWKFLQMDKSIVWCLWLSNIIQILPGRNLRDFFFLDIIFTYTDYIINLANWSNIMWYSDTQLCRELTLLNTRLR